MPEEIWAAWALRVAICKDHICLGSSVTIAAASISISLSISKGNRNPRRSMADPGSSENDSPSRTQDGVDEVMSADEIAEHLRVYQILTNPSQEEIIVTFVDGLMKAHQYFEFEDYLKKNCDFIKPDSSRHHIFKKVIHQQERKKMFNKLDEDLIMDAIQGRISDLNYAEILERRSKSRSGNIPYFKERIESLHRKFDDLRLMSEGSFNDPLFKLVYEARKGCYFLHESPKAELDKIMKSHPSFYDDFFIVPKFKAKPNFSERKVKVAYLPDDYTVEDVKKLLSDCGDIEAVELKRSEDETYAHVTFKNSESAKIAPYVADLYSTPIQGVLEEDIPPVVEPGDFGISCVKAMATYTQLHLRYSEPPPSVERDENRSRSKSPGASPSRSVRSRLPSAGPE